MKLNNCYKKPSVSIFAPYIFLFFPHPVFDTQLPEPKNPKTISDFFGNCALVFFGRDFNYSEEFATQKIGGGCCKFRLNGSEGFNKIFGIGIFENSLAAKIEGNCI